MNIFEKFVYPDQLDGFENRFIDVPMFAFIHAAHILRQQYPEGEHAIARDPKFSVLYATRVLKERFLLGEPSLIQNKEVITNELIWIDIPDWERSLPNSFIKCMPFSHYTRAYNYYFDMEL